PVSLAALERLARGESVPLAGQFDTEDDADRSAWRHPRERVGPVSAAEAALWAVLDRWDFADVDGWAQLLADATEDDHRAADDPRRGRRPGLVLQAWAASHQLGGWPASVELFDLATGQLVAADPRKVKPAAVASRFAALLGDGS